MDENTGAGSKREHYEDCEYYIQIQINLECHYVRIYTKRCELRLTKCLTYYLTLTSH